MNAMKNGFNEMVYLTLYENTLQLKKQVHLTAKPTMTAEHSEKQSGISVARKIQQF
jgi:hypothetical protein